MNLYDIRRLKRAASLAMLSSALLLGACATPDRPRVLQEASDRIKNSETTELEDLQPRLIREARQFEIKARQAFERRELDEAKLYANLAIQRYDTARNLVQRDASEQLAVLMADADTQLSVEEAQLDQEQRELARYDQLSSRFDSVKSELAQVREDQQGAAAQARRLLLKARSAQAEALGAGASATDPESYAKARFEVENALEAYDSNLFDESSSASQRAIASFEQLAEKSRESDRARRDAEKDMLAKNEQRKAQQGEQADLARQAIDEATDAQTTAIGARMPQERQALYQQGVFLLESAERRFRDNDFDGAVRKSHDARDIFLSASKDKNVTSGEIALGDGSQGTPTGQNADVLAAIQRAEDARGSALARGATLLDMERGDYALELARQARDRKENNRAIQKASEAAALYEGLGLKVEPAVAALPTGDGSFDMASSGDGSSRGLRTLAEEQIVRLQLERAEALGDMVDQSCPGSFREFEAVLTLAQQRFDARDYAQAFEFSVRASERLKQCEDVKAPVATTSASTKAVASGPAKPSTEERAEAAARENAATALSQAQGDYAVLDATGKPGAEDLREPQVLIVTAERWFKQKDYAQAEALAKRAVESMNAIALERAQKDPASAPTTAKTTPKKTEIAATKVPMKTPEQLAEEARLQELCRRVDSTIEQVKGAQLRASNVKLDDDAEARYKRAIKTLNRAQDLRRDERCESSELLAEESLASFEELVAFKADEPSSKDPGTTTSKQPNTSTQSTSKEPTAADRARNEQLAADASSAIASARIARAQVASQASNNVYVTADSLLKEAERANSSREYPRAEGLATQAAGAFKSLDANAPAVVTATGETIDPSWKPAYSKVLDALIRRDEVKDAIGDPEQDLFERGVKNLDRARTSWDSRDFMAAARFSDAAKDDFDKAVAAAEARKKEDEKKRAAQIAKENEAERQARLKREKEAADAAAKKAKDEAKAEADRKAASDKADKEGVVNARRAADDVLREAAIKRELCEKEMCSLRDDVALVRADETLSSAKKAMDSSDFQRAIELGSAALATYETILQKPRSFAITSKVTRVTLAGDRLILSPKVKFESGTTVIVAESMESVNELAMVLRENESTLKSVQLIGYTDSRGNDAKNLTLSEQRAAAVLKALTERGVKSSLLTSKGLGEASPVATNKTADGRELNRRVEVVIEKTKGE